MLGVTIRLKFEPGIIRSLLRVVIAVLILVYVPLASAQSVATGRNSPWDPSVSYKGGGAHFLQRQQTDNSGELETVFMPFSLTMGMAQHDIRFLVYPEVQEELELSDGQLAELKPIFERLESFDLVHIWNAASPCVPLRVEAIEAASELKDLLDESGTLGNILLPNQIKRLAQLQRRFALISMYSNSMRDFHWLVRQLNLSTKQQSEITAIVLDHSKAIAAEQKDWEAEFIQLIKKSLKDDSQETFSQICDQEQLFSRNPVILVSQLSDFYDFTSADSQVRSRPSSKSNDLDGDSNSLVILHPVLLPNGRFCTLSQYFHRSEFNPPTSSWRQLAVQLRDAKSTWFELADFQREDLKQIVDIQEQNGFVSDRFVGQDLLYEHWEDRPTDFEQNKDAYGKWIESGRKIEIQVNDQVEQGLRELLMPHQLAILEFGTGLSQLPELGIWHLLNRGMLVGKVKVADSGIDQIEEKISIRRKEVLKRINELESAVTKIFNDDQKVMFKELFGESVAFYATFWSGFSGPRF